MDAEQGAFLMSTQEPLLDSSLLSEMKCTFGRQIWQTPMAGVHTPYAESVLLTSS